MTSNHNHLQNKLEELYSEKDRRKRKRMKVTGKSVFALQRLIEQRPMKNVRKKKPLKK